MSAPGAKNHGAGWETMLLLLVVVLGLLLGAGCLPGRVQFSNDGPLGRAMSESHRLPARFFGCWQDLNSIGDRDGAAVPSLSYGLETLVGPLWFAKLYAPFGLALLGFSAWSLFRQWRLAPPACLLGGLAASLNSAFFSTACWGVAAHPITVGMAFLALAALADKVSPRRWLRVLLAGFALGMGVVEGADIGAIFSLVVAGYVGYEVLTLEGPKLRGLSRGAARVALLTVCAAAVAAASVGDLLVTSVDGVVAAGAQETRSEIGHWEWATQWSLPKVEALGLVVPGLFGYRTDTLEGGNYWGATGRHAVWDRYLATDRKGPQPQALLRYVGGGNYVGVVVALIAVWAVAQSLRRTGPWLIPSRRRLIWFWSGIGLVSLLFAFGRHAPFYRLVYALPYFSTIRNPVKFLHVFSLAVVVLFALGIDGLWRGFLRPGDSRSTPPWRGWGQWWAQAEPTDKRWVWGCVATLGLTLAGWAVYAFEHQALEDYLQAVLFSPYLASTIAAFSIRQVGWFVLFFVLAALLVLLMLSGVFRGERARAAMVLLGLVMVLDLARANLPWIKSWDYSQKYATNPVIDRLRDKPYEHRVANLPRDFLSPEFQRAYGESDQVATRETVLFRLYDFEWVQHLFGYYNIQSLNLVQLSRKPADLKAFEESFTPQSMSDLPRVYPRYWQLTNTRYLLGDMAFLPFLNLKLDPAGRRFRVVEPFNLKPAEGHAGPREWADMRAVAATNGDYALIEFTGALPRAQLYTRWQMNTNDQETLRMLGDPNFDPQRTVLVAGELPTNAAPGEVTPAAGNVEFARYTPKDIVLQANPTAPAVLLLNDRFDPDWHLQVDGRPQTLLRCNYLMRGAFLPPGPHTVEFMFQPRHQALYVSLASVTAALALLGVVAWTGRRGESGSRETPNQNRQPQPSPNRERRNRGQATAARS